MVPVRHDLTRSAGVQASFFAFNPKAGGATHVQRAVASAFPQARHLFMYRACAPVVNSFVGLLTADESLYMRSWRRLWWWWYGESLLPSTLVAALHEQLSVHSLPLAKLSSLQVARSTLRWLESVLGWLELQAADPLWLCVVTTLVVGRTAYPSS